jgi:sodium transport system permease protein
MISKTVLAVVKKEWRDSIRDRRSVTAAVIFAIAGPALIALMIAAKADRETSDEPFKVHVSGAEYAPDLADYLVRHQVELFEGDERVGVNLEVPDDYADRFGRGRMITVVLAADQSKSADRRDVQRLEQLVQRYSASLGQMRLSLRGVAPGVGRPLAVDVQDLATREAKGSDILGGLTIYFLMASFIGSMAVSIDVAAGERERNSLEVLMAQPVSSRAVFAGKTAVASVFGAFGIALTIVISKLAFLKVPLAKIGLTWTLDWVDASLMLASLLPLAILVAALQIALSLWAKTFKEASAYLNILMFVPMGVALAILVKEIDAAVWMYSVPLLGHQLLLRSMIRAEAVQPMLVFLLTASTLTLATVLVHAGGWMLTRERIVFGQSD